jgi:hypothetical protein
MDYFCKGGAATLFSRFESATQLFFRVCGWFLLFLGENLIVGCLRFSIAHAFQGEGSGERQYTV